MNRLDVRSARLKNQRLTSSQFSKAVDVVRWFGAVQAQDFNAAKWALALRMHKATEVSIDEAFNKGEVLRTHIIRPTWHFVAPEDIRWLLQLTAPRVNLRSGSGYRMFELDTAVFKRSHKTLAKTLQGGRYLPRSALKAALNLAGIDVNNGVRLGHVLLRAELDGVICSGPRVGKQLTYALFEERVPTGKTFTRDEALVEITRRYFASHGPATLQDFVWWSGLTVEDARKGIFENNLEKSVVDEKVYWLPRASQTRPSSPNLAHLLPAFDEYFVAYKNRQIASDSLSTWEVLGPTFIIDGIAAGTWKRTKSTGVELTPSRALRKAEKLALQEAVDRYTTFLS